MALELPVLSVYSNPNSQKGGWEDGNAFISSLGVLFCLLFYDILLFHCLVKAAYDIIHFSCCFLTKYTIICTVAAKTRQKK